MSLRKLFENVSTSEFLRDIYIGHIKSKNNEQCIKSHYIVLNVHSGKPGLLVKCNLIVTNTLFCTEYLVALYRLDPISIF